tara:strand:+ start:26905 stop:28779 length:1875 start_codon:yes stop_codon:yes gene_type:complete
MPLMLLVGVLCWWWLRDHDVPPPVVEGVSTEHRQPASKLPVDPVNVVRDRPPEPIAESIDYGDEPPDADLEHPYSFALSVNLRGPLGLPVDDARVYLAPEMAGFSEWPEPSLAGNVAVAWQGRTRTMRVQVAVTAWGVLQPIRSIVIEADQPARIAFSVTGRTDALSALRLAAERGDEVELKKLAEMISRQRFRRKRMDSLDIECGRTMLEFKLHRCTECHERSFVAPYQAVARSGTMAPGLHTQSSFEDLRRSRMHGAAGEKKLAELEAAREQQKQERIRKAANYQAILHGLVQLPDGSVKSGMVVAWIGESGAVLRTATTDHAGQYWLGPMAGGEQRVIVAAGPLGVADRSVRVVPTGRTVANFTLSTDQFVIGKVLDEGGDPLKDWRVELVRDASGWAAKTHTDDTGTFAAYGVPGAVECLVWPRGKKQAFPVLYGVEALVDASAIVLSLRADHPIRGRLRARASLPEGHVTPRIDARVTQIETGRVANMEAFGFANEFALEPLAPGMYRVQFGSPGLGWATRDIHVDGRGLWDMGGIHMAGPGRVHIVQLPGAPDLMQYPHAFYRRTEAVDVRVDYEVDGDVLLLAPGRHVLVWQATGEVRSREFEVVSGVQVEVPIWPE